MLYAIFSGANDDWGTLYYGATHLIFYKKESGAYRNLIRRFLYITNYMAGLITSPFVAWLIIFNQKMWLTISIAATLVIILFFACYGIAKVKRPKNISPQPHKSSQK